MIIAVDVGTSSVKVGLVDERGSLVDVYTQSAPLYIPTDLAAEHVLESIWAAVMDGIAAVARRYRNRVAAVSLSTYLHGLGVLDSSFSVVVNVMTHLDRRCRAEQRIVEEQGYELYTRTGCPPLFTFPLCKTLWLRRRNLLKHTHRLTFVKDYIVYRLSGRHAVDLGVASGTGFLNIHQLKWDSKALDLAGIDESMLPELHEGSRVFDYISIRDLGLERVALVLGSFDGALQNIGYGVYGEKAVLNIGSTAVVRTLVPNPVVDRAQEMRFFTYYAAEGHRVVGGASNNGMTAVEWVKSLAGVDRFDVSEDAVCRDGVFVLPFVAGERYPFRDPNLTLTATGLRLEHRREHLFKALIEGVGFTVRSILTALEENGVHIDHLHCGGGGCSDYRIVKIFADVLCKPIAVHRDPRNATILGAALVGRRAMGLTASLTDADSLSREVLTHIYPSNELCAAYSSCIRRFLLLVRTMQSIEGDPQ
ncbi:MAG: FGGY family carbohydrate kinase [Ignisphaera sp.]|nr:FGGY family carbohydrate kinase [Ignisphaera sp.]MDW8085847.1 FGGY family carbohydrate kinase [Ignisphaera sp.]